MGDPLSSTNHHLVQSNTIIPPLLIQDTARAAGRAPPLTSSFILHHRRRCSNHVPDTSVLLSKCEQQRVKVALLSITWLVGRILCRWLRDINITVEQGRSSTACVRRGSNAPPSLVGKECIQLARPWFTRELPNLSRHLTRSST